MKFPTYDILGYMRNVWLLPWIYHNMKKFCTMARTCNVSRIQFGGIETLGVPPHWSIFWSGGIETFWAQKVRQEKLLKLKKILNHKNFSCITYYIYIYIYIYILFIKITETFWSRDITNIWILANFELKIHKGFWTYRVSMRWIILNILQQNVSKSDKKNCRKNYIESLCAKLF